MEGSGRPDAEIARLLEFAEGLADAAAEVTLPWFRRIAEIENKASGALYDPVTAADREAERAIRDRIKAAFPDHGILGEEHGAEPGPSSLTWVIDPIDGTRGFITGIPLWGTLIALNDGGVPIAGVVDQPYLRERFVGSRLGAWMRRDGIATPLRTRAAGVLGSAVLLCTDPAMFRGQAECEAFATLSERARLVRYGTDCYGYCMLASGLADLVVESGLQPYDVQALVPIVEAAGGIITAWDGGSPYQGGQVVAAGCPEVHAAARAILADAAR